MKKWLNSENLTTFALTVAAVVTGIALTPMILGWFAKAKAKATTTPAA